MELDYQANRPPLVTSLPYVRSSTKYPRVFDFFYTIFSSVFDLNSG